MIYGNAKAQVPLIPLWGKQNIQAKEAYCFIIRSIKTDVSLLALAKSI